MDIGPIRAWGTHPPARIPLLRALRVGAVVAGLILALAAATASASGASCYSQEGCVEQARSAEDFTASVGVNTHLGYSQTVYWRNWPMVRDRLLELGVSHIRDGTFPVSWPESIAPVVAARYNELAAAGIKGNLLVGHEQAMTPTTVAQRLEWVRENIASFTMSIEGSNEFETHGGDAERVRSLRAMQCEIYERVKTDPVLASKPVVGPSSGNFYSDDIWYDEIGDLSACLDRGNLHPYSGVDPPHRRLSRDLGVAMRWARAVYGDKPLWATELGYVDMSSSIGVSQAAAATYIPRSFLEYFRRGFERSQAYELVDLDSGSGQVLDNYGLLRTDGTRKPAFIALRNMLRIVRDTGPASGRLGFAIVCTANCRNGDPDAYPTQDGPIRHVLLKHSTGAYFLAVWSESQVWDATAQKDTPKAAQSMRLELHEAPAKVEIFDPASASAPVSTDTSGSPVIRTQAPDAVRIIKITPRIGAAPPPALVPAVPPVASAVPPAVATPAALISDVPAANATPSARSDSATAGGEAQAPAAATCVRSRAVQPVRLSKARHAKIRAHYLRSVRRGWPRILVLNREGADRRTDKLLKKIAVRKGRAPASYPPAIGRGRGGRGLTQGRRPTGWRAAVAYVPAGENRSHEATMNASLGRFCDGTRFRYVFR